VDVDVDVDAELIVRRFWRCVFDEGDLSVVEGMVTPEFAWRGSLGTQTFGARDFLAYVRAAQRAMPDLAVGLDELSMPGEQVWTRMTFTATHRGTLLGVPASGRALSYQGLAVHDLRDDVLSRVWVVADTLDLHRQLVGEV